MKLFSSPLAVLRNLTFVTVLLIFIATCRKNDDATVTPKTGDLPTDVLTPTNILVKVSDLPAPDTNASSVNYPQLLMEQPASSKFHVPQGFAISVFSKVLDARWLAVAPNGDVFVAQTNMNQITVLRDKNNDGVADESFVWGMGGMLDKPHGMVFNGGYFYVGATEAILRYAYTAGQTTATGEPVKLATLPGGGQHVTRNIIIKDNKLYASIGSSVNVGVEGQPVRTTIQQFNLDGSGQVTYASGLRNAVGLDINPVTKEIWTAVIERDGLGDELVPDYFTSVKQGGFYGYPFAYLAPGKLDPRMTAISSPLTATTITPDVLFKAHETAIGALFYKGSSFPANYLNDAFVTLHGSWNRSKGAGYKIVRVRMNQQGTPQGGYEDFVTGWQINPNASGPAQVFGRPIGIVQNLDGSLLVSDDASGTVWRIRYKG